ncbi:MAG: hypothetical protein AB7O88_23725 [Reyranellaceae bacterium]
MVDTMLPILRQLHDAPDDRARARLLLATPDAVMAKYRPVFEAACRRASFDLGLEFIQWRRAAWHAVRGPDGHFLKPDFDQVRIAFAAFARGDGASS